MLKSLVDYSDDEEDGGQVSIRNRMHMSGFYPSFCKIDLTSQLQSLKQCNEYHISLSLSFQLNYHQIKDFLKQLQQLNFPEFQCTLQQESTVFTNTATNKQYAVLLVDINKEKMISLMEAIRDQITGFDNLYQVISLIPHLTIRDHPFKVKEIHIKVSDFIVQIGKDRFVIKL